MAQLLKDTRLRNCGWPPSACASADRISASTTSFSRLWRRYTRGPLRKSMYGLLLIYLSVESRVKRKWKGVVIVARLYEFARPILNASSLFLLRVIIDFSRVYFFFFSSGEEEEVSLRRW